MSLKSPMEELNICNELNRRAGNHVKNGTYLSQLFIRDQAVALDQILRRIEQSYALHGIPYREAL